MRKITMRLICLMSCSAFVLGCSNVVEDASNRNNVLLVPYHLNVKENKSIEIAIQTILSATLTGASPSTATIIDIGQHSDRGGVSASLTSGVVKLTTTQYFDGVDSLPFTVDIAGKDYFGSIDINVVAKSWQEPQLLSDPALGRADFYNFGFGVRLKNTLAFNQTDQYILYFQDNRYFWKQYDSDLLEWNLVTEVSTDAMSVTIASNRVGNIFAAWSFDRLNTEGQQVANLMLQQFNSNIFVDIDPMLDPELSSSVETVLSNRRGDIAIIYCRCGNFIGDYFANIYTVENGWFGEQQITNGTGFQFAIMDSTMDEQGNMMVVWSYTNDSRKGVHFNRFVMNEDKLSGQWENPNPNTIDDLLLGLSGRPVVKINSVGDAIVVWPLWDGTRSTIAYRFYDSVDGWKDQGEIEPPDPNNTVTEFDVGIDDQGNSVVIWTQMDEPPVFDQDITAYAPVHIYSSIYRQSLGWSSPIKMDTVTGKTSKNNSTYITHITRFSLDINPAGLGAGAWIQYNEQNDNRELWVSRISTQHGWMRPIRIDSENNILKQMLKVNMQGDVLVSWIELDFRYNILATRFQNQ